MDIGDFVIVINKDRNLYRRRCKILQCIIDGSDTKYLVYSEGLEEEELLLEHEIEKSVF